jgi:hypothetical protein
MHKFLEPAGQSKPTITSQFVGVIRPVNDHCQAERMVRMASTRASGAIPRFAS